MPAIDHTQAESRDARLERAKGFFRAYLDAFTQGQRAEADRLKALWRELQQKEGVADE